MSGTDAWMPLYIGDYLGDTQRLTTEQHGAYLLLIMDYWRNGAPPADDAVLAQIARLEPAAWQRHAPMLRRFFQVEDGLWRHKRIERELATAKAKHESVRIRGARGAMKRWGDSAQGRPAEDGPGNGSATGPANGLANGQAIAQPMADGWQSQSQSQPQSPSQPQPQPAPGLGLPAADPKTPSSPALAAAAPPPKKAAAPENREEEPADYSLPDSLLEDRPPLLSLLQANGQMFHVAHELVARLQGQYRAVDVAQQLRQMQAWLEANPRQRKTAAGMMRFIAGWLQREQAQAPKRPPAAFLGVGEVL